MKLYTRSKALELQTGECELLSVATVRWTDVEGFRDDQVARVKEVFRRAFDLPPSTALVGSAFPDGIVLQEAGDNRVFYVIMAGVGERTWEGAKLDCEEGQGMGWVPGMRIRQVLALLAKSDDIGLSVVAQ
jgi:hypothetical protein